MIKLMVIGCFLTGCWGNTSVDNALIGQVKRVHNETPLICGDYMDVDISLGVIRGGVGSMSTHDVVLTISTEEQARVLRSAQERGKLVRVTYDARRFCFCQAEEKITDVEVLEDGKGK